MTSIKKIKAEAPLAKKITRGEEEVIPSLQLKERIPTAGKVKQDLVQRKKGKGKA